MEAIFRFLVVSSPPALTSVRGRLEVMMWPMCSTEDSVGDKESRGIQDGTINGKEWCGAGPNQRWSVLTDYGRTGGGGEGERGPFGPPYCDDPP